MVVRGLVRRVVRGVVRRVVRGVGVSFFNSPVGEGAKFKFVRCVNLSFLKFVLLRH